MVKTIEYLSLSALAYVDFKESDAGLTLDEIIRDEQKKKSRKDFNINNPELSALKNESNPLRSYILLDYISTPPLASAVPLFRILKQAR
jgi:hypothetical protein